MQSIQKWHNRFEKYVEDQTAGHSPASLYDPVEYIMNQSGKRLRPLLVLLAAEACHSDPEKFLPIAYAVEVFHNFTLVHDDIMDDAAIRRGQESVYKKYGITQAILSGDLMNIQSYEYVLGSDLPRKIEALRLFTSTNREICEGQQWDMDFESESIVSREDYLKMIEYKTAVLMGCSLALGAEMSQVSDEDVALFYAVGKNAGIGFQIQDDYLDTFGSQASVGKMIGGDIVQSKKTILYVLTLESLDSLKEKDEFISFYSSDTSDKVTRIKSLFLAHEVDKKAKTLEESYLNQALSDLTSLKDKGYDIDPIMRLLVSLKDRQK